MKRSFLDSVLRGAEALAARDPVGTMPDRELIARFATESDPTAFAVLVRRHGPLVWGVCRNLLPADADAEDAFQATFLALVRSAATIRQKDTLGGWLHGVAYRVALKARRTAARRKTREKVAAIGEADSPVPDAAWDDLQAAVHEEVCRLPDKLRLPFVLCGLQGRAQKDAAKELGWTIGTFSGRLSEARRRLLERLARRGVPVGMAVGAAVLGGVASGASVPSLLTTKLLTAAGSPDAISPNVLSLARGVTHVYMTRTKLLAVSVVLAGLLTTGIGANVLSKADAQAPGDPNQESVKRAIDFLKSHPVARDRFEYKFVPVEKPLTTSEMQKVLAMADQEGWSYSGSQELAQEKTGKITPHMVFKRPTGAATANETRDQERLKAALMAEREARAQALDREAEARAAAQDAATKAQQLEKEALSRENAARKAAELLQNRAAAEQRVAADAALREADKAKKLAADETDVARRKELEEMKAKYEAVIREMEAEMKKAKISGPNFTDPFAKTPAKHITSEIKLTNISGQDAARELGKHMPVKKVIANVTPKSITLIGTEAEVTEAKALIEKTIDVKTTGKTELDPLVGKDLTLLVIPLKFSKADEIAQMISKLFGESKLRVTSEPVSNSLLVAGHPDVLAELKKVVTELDVKGKAGGGK